MLLCKACSFPDLLETLRTEFVEPFADLRYYLLPAVEAAVALVGRDNSINISRNNLSRRMFLLLNILPTPGEAQTLGTSNWTPHAVSRTKSENELTYKSSFVSVWSSYLQLEELKLSPDLYQEILTTLPTKLLPWMATPLELAKFFLLGFHEGDVSTAVQALSGLFYLLVKARLGEPQLVGQAGADFYRRLLSLLQPKVFSLPIRVRFLRLLRLSIQSKMLSTEMRAMFIKKLVAGEKEPISFVASSYLWRHSDWDISDY